MTSDASIPSRCGHVGLAGRPNAGKSSLLNRLVGQHLAIVSPKAQATRLPTVGLRTDVEHGTQFVFHDLPGLLDPEYLMQRRMRHLAEEALRRVDLILHLHPAPEAPAPPLATLLDVPLPPHIPVLVVYTKGDLLPTAERRRMQAEALVVSSRTGGGIDALLAAIRPHLPEGPFEFDPDDIGTQPLRFFVVEYLREAAFEFLEDELPYAFTAEVEEFREEASPVYIRVHLYVERESQKGMLIGKGGATLKQIGQHARKRLEALLGQPVFLETWVKVLPRWRRDPAALTRFGFPKSEEER